MIKRPLELDTIKCWPSKGESRTEVFRWSRYSLSSPRIALTCTWLRKDYSRGWLFPWLLCFVPSSFKSSVTASHFVKYSRRHTARKGRVIATPPGEKISLSTTKSTPKNPLPVPLVDFLLFWGQIWIIHSLSRPDPWLNHCSKWNPLSSTIFFNNFPPFMTSMTAMPALLELNCLTGPEALLNLRPSDSHLARTLHSQGIKRQPWTVAHCLLMRRVLTNQGTRYREALEWKTCNWLLRRRLRPKQHALHDKFDSPIYESSMEESRERR